MNQIEDFKNHYFNPVDSTVSPTAKESKKLLKFIEQQLASVDFSLKLKLTKKVNALNKRVEGIEEACEVAQQKIADLEGGEATKIYLIGTLIKLFFNWYHSSLITKENQHIQELLHNKTKYEAKIVNLRKILNTSESRETAKIFEMEHWVRVALENNFPHKEKYQKLYEKTVLPLVKGAKATIKRHPLHFAAQAAAAKGKAVQAGLQALKELAENKPVIENSKVSKQQVFLLPQQGAVFKSSVEQAKEEETTINALFDLMSKQAVVGAFDIQKASVDKFGIQFSEEVAARGFNPDALSPSLRTAIKQRLPNNDLLIFEKHEKTPKKADPALDNYQNIKQQKWFVQFPGKGWQKIPFQELQNRNLAKELPPETLIGDAQETAISVQDHILNETPFFQALNYLPTLQTPPQNVYVSPDLSIPKIKAAYQLCEKFKWEYKNDKGERVEADFKTVHVNHLEGKIMQDLKAVKNKETAVPTKLTLFTALRVQWKMVSPELMQLDAGALAELSNIQAKPFISDMILMKDLNKDLRAVVLDRLTPDAEFNAILTGELQLLDLHQSNLGIAPAPNDAYERFKNLKFTVDLLGVEKSFQELLLDFLAGQILPDDLITFTEEGKTERKALKELPELQKAFNVNWQWVIFDTDLSLTEDNRLQLQVRAGVEEHLIPVRSVLLQTEWKNKPLSKETIKRLMDSDERDLRVKNWIAREDAPIYKHLSPSVKQDIQQQLAPFIEQITLSWPRKKISYEKATLKTLQQAFVGEIADIAQSEILAIWEAIEKDLSVKLKKASYDLTSTSADAMKKRERIAAQLFPRITYRQQTALLERQRHRKEYLTSYQELTESSFTGTQLITQIEQFLQKPSTPLTSVRKEALLNQLKNPMMLLNHLKQTICDECQPTYFNLMKAMYPLLADTYALNRMMYGNEEEAGASIGLYIMPLETTIGWIQSRFSAASPEGRLAANLQKQINSIHDPAFFGYWG